MQLISSVGIARSTCDMTGKQPAEGWAFKFFYPAFTQTSASPLELGFPAARPFHEPAVVISGLTSGNHAMPIWLISSCISSDDGLFVGSTTQQR